MDPSLEGRTGAPFTMAVEVGKVREFAVATKSRNPDYAGGVGDHPVIPGTFLMTATFWQSSEHSPLHGAAVNWHRVLHGEQEFVFHGEPPRAGDVLTGTTRIDRMYEKQGKRGGTMAFVETVTEFRDPAGELLVESRHTIIETSQAAS